MNVILLAHAVTREHKDPELDAPFKRWTLKLHNKLSEATAEWTGSMVQVPAAIGAVTAVVM